jgi:transmembrane sensor
MASDGTIRQQARDWAVRTGDPAFVDWEAFTLWLEADPAHALAYDEVMTTVSDAADLLAAHPASGEVGSGTAAANDDADDVPMSALSRIGPVRRAWLGGAVAACLALVGALWMFQAERRDLYTLRTGAGETRSISLEAGTSVDIAGGTIITFDRRDRRFARLEEGQALFTVRHDAARPFEVMVGDERLVDVGTVFDVQRGEADALSVAVAEGAVQFDPEGANLRVSPGEMLHREGRGETLTLSKLPAAQVGEWREGRLTFDAAPLAVVADRLSRATGIDYAAAPGSGSASVSGSILIGPLRADPAAIGPLLGLSVRAEGRRWVIGSD